MSKRKVDFNLNYPLRGFSSQRAYADDYADLVDAVKATKKAYDAWRHVVMAIQHERRHQVLRGGTSLSDVAKAVRSALDTAETVKFWEVVALCQQMHKVGSYNASVELAKQMFGREAGAFLGKFGTYLLN